MDASNIATGGDAGVRRPVGRPKGPPKESLPILQIREVPHPIKNALLALSEVGTIGFDEDGFALRSTHGSQHRAVKTLLMYGMLYIEPYMTRYLENEKRSAATYADIVRAFIDDPTLSRVTEANFAEGSPAHAEMLRHREDIEFDSGPGAWAREGFSRKDAFDRAAEEQGSVEKLGQAFVALRAVTDEYREPRAKVRTEHAANDAA